MILKEIFAVRLKELRLENNLNIPQFAQLLGVNIRLIKFYENSKSKTLPTVDRLKQICIHLNCSADYLMGLSDTEKKS
ncbi:MAG: helix-turn-helix domain-containing protein [Clostridiales bacterium]|jgi:transcriptional regulator with XRE-family HTH domain|nr:helix-turn-helix domain-containing protein [Clostridiales bacterium]